jgi:hypothetical protein
MEVERDSEDGLAPIIMGNSAPIYFHSPGVAPAAAAQVQAVAAAPVYAPQFAAPAMLPALAGFGAPAAVAVRPGPLVRLRAANAAWRDVWHNYTVPGVAAAPLALPLAAVAAPAFALQPVTSVSYVPQTTYQPVQTTSYQAVPVAQPMMAAPAPVAAQPVYAPQPQAAPAYAPQPQASPQVYAAPQAPSKGGRFFGK